MNKILLPLLIMLTSALAPCAWAGFEDDLADTGKTENSQPFRDLKARAEAGDADAQLNMGGLYFKGEGVARDLPEAAKWFLKAADQHHPQAQFNLGMMYATGQGVTQNHDEAVKWYRLSAEQGLAVAQLNLGVAYFMGQGVPRSEAEAVKWLRLAANQGDAQAQFNLAVMYANGQGIPQDFVESYRLAGLAEAQGHTTAKALRADLKARMSPEQLAAATGQQAAASTAEPATPAAEPVQPPPAEQPTPGTAPEESALPTVPAASNNTPAVAAPRGHSRAIAHSANDGKHYLQLGAFKSEQEAEKFIAEAKHKLGKFGKSLSIYSTDNWVRVHIGPYPDAASARRAATLLKHRYGFDTIVKRH
ncbi:MAG: SPOR domain-containing protein [Gallionella sp.]|nr:SPOR domain-containing protein [Gallionella sp.]MDD4947699.1 SPOR domain-containing protein [Gallionella sp.]MDD5612534.1 SPOR domain-containing protein [Gallionella sp.]